jgi:hypothetical protein
MTNFEITIYEQWQMYQKNVILDQGCKIFFTIMIDKKLILITNF